MAKRKGFIWTRKKAWAICKGKRVLFVTETGYPELSTNESEMISDLQIATDLDFEDEQKQYRGATIRPCEIVVKVKGD